MGLEKYIKVYQVTGSGVGMLTESKYKTKISAPGNPCLKATALTQNRFCLPSVGKYKAMMPINYQAPPDRYIS